MESEYEVQGRVTRVRYGTLYGVLRTLRTVFSTENLHASAVLVLSNDVMIILLVPIYII